MTITKSEFSDGNDFDVKEMQDEESTPDDEFFYKRQERNRKTRANFGSTFTTNFNNTSSKREVTRDFSTSSSRNVERSSTFDRKTTHKVRTKKGDKFEENSWSSSGNQENGTIEQDGSNEVFVLPGLGNTNALAGARFAPEQSPSLATEIRARASQPQKSEIPEDIPQKKTYQEKLKSSKEKPSKEWRWFLFILILILIILVAATVHNFEKLPLVLNVQFQPPAVAESSKTSAK